MPQPKQHGRKAQTGIRRKKDARRLTMENLERRLLLAADIGAIAEGEHDGADDLLRLRLETTLNDGTPIDAIGVGQPFQLRGFVEDLRDDAEGAFSVFLDVEFDPQIVGLAGDVEFARRYSLITHVDASQPGLLDELGAVQRGIEAVGPGEFLVFAVPMAADRLGRVEFEGNPADHDDHITLLNGIFEPIASEHVIFGSVSLDVVEGGDPPNAGNDRYGTDEDQPLRVGVDDGVLHNDEGSSSAELTAHLARRAEHGRVELQRDGSFVYTPREDFVGVDQFTYRAFNGASFSEPATVEIDVEGANDAPVAVNDQYLSRRGEELLVRLSDGLLTNDIDPDGDELSARVVEEPSNGELYWEENGAFRYRPREGFVGVDEFVYEASDGALSDRASVRIRVLPRDNGDQLVALNLAAVDADGRPIESVEAGSTFFLIGLTEDLRREGAGVLSAFMDVFYSTNTVSAAGDIEFGADYPLFNRGSIVEDRLIDEVGGAINLVNMELNLSPGEHVLFQVPFRADRAGEARFEADPADEDGHDVIIQTDRFLPLEDHQIRFDTLTIEVVGEREQNLPPVGHPEEYVGAEDGTLRVGREEGVLANDEDPNGDRLAALLVRPPLHGAFELHENGGFVYRPDRDFSGADSFIYQAFDGGLRSESVTVGLSIESVNDPPQAAPDHYSTSAGETLNVDAPGVIANDVDIDGEIVGVELEREPRHGEVELSRDGGFVYTPADGFVGWDSFEYIAADGEDLSAPTSVSILVVDPSAPLVTVGLRARPLVEREGDGNGFPFPHGLWPAPGEGNDRGNPLPPDHEFPGGEFAVGQPFVLDVYVTDLRWRGVGVGAAFVDVNFDAGALNVTGEVKPGHLFPAATSGDASVDGLIDEAGGARAEIGPTIWNGPGPHRLFSVPMVGELAGQTNLALSPADLEEHGVTLIGVDGVIDPDRINYRDLIIEIFDVDGAPPLARPDAYEVREDEILRVDAETGVLANDEGDIIGAHLSDRPEHGHVEMASNGAFVYLPDFNFSGDDRFTYRAIGRNGRISAETAVSISVAAVNDAPRGRNDRYTLPGGTLEVSAEEGVLSNDFDPDEDRLFADLLESPQAGQVQLNADGSFIYTPDDSEVGADSFVYAASDGVQASEPTRVFLRSIEPLVRFRLEAADDEGNPIEEISVGEPFMLNVHVDDLRPDAQGVAYAHLDVEFDHNLIEPDGDLEHSDDFDLFGGEGIVTTVGGSILYGGGALPYPRPERGDIPTSGLLFSAPFTAAAEGLVEFNGGPAFSEFVEVALVDVEDQALIADEVDYGLLELDIVADQVAREDLVAVSIGVPGNEIEVLVNDELGEGFVLTDVSTPSGGGAAQVTDDGVAVNYSPPLDFRGSEAFTYTARGDNGVTETGSIVVVVGSKWHNAENQFDSNGDGQVDLTDPFDVIGGYRIDGFGALPVEPLRRGEVLASRPDVNGNGRRDPQDAFMVIDQVFDRGPHNSEGEASDAAFSSTGVSIGTDSELSFRALVSPHTQQRPTIRALRTEVAELLADERFELLDTPALPSDSDPSARQSDDSDELVEDADLEAVIDELAGDWSDVWSD